MRPPIARAQIIASRSALTPKRAFTQHARLRNQPITAPHYEPPSPKDSKGNDARLSRFSKILGIAVGSAIAFAYSVYKHKTGKNAAAAGGGVGQDRMGL
jgi:hypothetical protein